MWTVTGTALFTGKFQKVTGGVNRTTETLIRDYRYSQIWFGLRCKFPIWSDWNIRYTTKGKTRYAMVRAAQVAVAALAIITAYRFRGGKDMLIYGKMLVDRLKSAAARSASRSQ